MNPFSVSFPAIRKACPGQAQRNRRRLALHIAVLAMVCVLPFIGLALYFLSSGLHREIAVAEEERKGLAHVSQTVSALTLAVRLAWSESGDNPEEMLAMDHALNTLDGTEASMLRLVPTRMPTTTRGGGRDVRSIWRDVRTAAPSSPERLEALRHLASRLHHGIFQAANSTGLNSGAENEISALTDAVAVAIPLHVERLLHMHEALLPILKANGWDPSARRVANVFIQQLRNEDIIRLDRSVSAALAADRESAHVTPSFQDEYPAQAQAMLEGLERLAGVMGSNDSSTGQAITPDVFDEEIDRAFESAVAGWNASILQLDRLVADQISEAGRHRDHALFLAALVSLALAPMAWLYFRIFIRPVMQTIIDDAANHQREAEAARAEASESTRRLRQTQAALFGHSSVILVSLEHQILDVNDRLCEISGFTRQELCGTPFDPFACHEGDADRMEEIWRTVERGVVWNGSLCHVSKGGGFIWVNATLFPFLGPEGKPVEFVVIETDITELVKARQDAEEAVRSKSQFLAMMSHEIRTPLNAVIGFAQILADTLLDGNQRDYVRTILTSGESLLVIINDILDFSKLEAGRTELEMRPVPVEALVEDILDLLGPQARSKNVEMVHWISPAAPAVINADGPRLRQVLLNLAGNALKFTSAGHVEIVVEPDAGEMLSFHVRDTGIGIPPERRNRLFQAFSQVDVSDSRNYGGTGLGLAISQRLTGLMGGTIGVESEPGRGSDFHFSVPFGTAGALVSGASPTVLPEETAKALRSRRILVVDDLEAGRRFMNHVLTRCGAEVVAVASWSAALDALGRGSFDLAVLDYIMPEGSGFSLAAEIRKIPSSHRLPLVLVASMPPPQGEDGRFLFETVLFKPLRIRTFAAAVARALGGGSRKPLESPRTPTSKNLELARFAAAHPLRIAVVDDNPVNLKFMRATLSAAGYQPVLFSSARAVLEALRNQKFDLILMDIQMPGMDGHEATALLRSGGAGELNRACRVIALTAGAMAEERAACLEAGMDDFISKPVSRPELLEKLAVASARASGGQ